MTEETDKLQMELNKLAKEHTDNPVTLKKAIDELIKNTPQDVAIRHLKKTSEDNNLLENTTDYNNVSNDLTPQPSSEPQPQPAEPPSPPAEPTDEEIAAKLAKSEQLLKENFGTTDNPIIRGGAKKSKKRKITKKKKKSKKRKTKRKYKTGKRN
tara:strand:+ start:83 stop:544 length:462 start_codon:yes stop_codon:yes gene_type:complete